MRRMPVPVIGGAYSDDALEWSAQDCVNLIPVAAERGETRTPSKLVSAPGLRAIVQLSGAIRGMRNVEGKLFVVAGQNLVWIKADYSVRYLGTIPGSGRVSMTHNQIANGNELVVVNGSAGYVYNTYTETLTQISDDAFVGAIVCDYVDSYILGVEPGRRFWFHSELADASSYLTTDQYEAESSPDRIRSLVVSHREVVVLGERTTEVWINTGAQSATFERATGTVIETGCIATHSAVRLDNSVFWLGDDLIVYRLDGYNPRRISTRPIERDIARSSKAALANAFAYTFEDRGHKIYYLTLQDGKTWGYDASTGEWHRRESFGLDRWRVNAMVRWENLWIAGDYTNGKLYVVDWDHMLDNGSPLVRERITGAQHADMNPFRVHGVELIVAPGPYLSSAAELIGLQGDAPDGGNYQPYSYTYTTIGGTAPYVYSIASGALPSGITIPDSSVATISGTLPADTTATFRLKVVDANGLIAYLDDTITVGVPITCTPYAETDADWASVVSLLSFNGADGSTTFTDEKGIVWSAAGSLAEISSEQVKYCTGAGKFFNTSPHSAIRTDRNPAFDLPGEFTLEADIYLNVGGSGDRVVFSNFQAGSPGNGNGGLGVTVGADNRIRADSSGVVTVLTSTGTIPEGEWVHIALSRDSGNNLRWFINGVLDSTVVSAATFTESGVTSGIYIGAYDPTTPTSMLDGYIDNFRLTKGVCRYTATFTPPTSTHPNTGP